MFNKTKQLEDKINELEKNLNYTKRQFKEYFEQLYAWVKELHPTE